MFLKMITVTLLLNIGSILVLNFGHVEKIEMNELKLWMSLMVIDGMANGWPLI
jgi:hypothetical protein